jgi:hypothetical protein
MNETKLIFNQEGITQGQTAVFIDKKDGFLYYTDNETFYPIYSSYISSISASEDITVQMNEIIHKEYLIICVNIEPSWDNLDAILKEKIIHTRQTKLIYRPVEEGSPDGKELLVFLSSNKIFYMGFDADEIYPIYWENSGNIKDIYGDSAFSSIESFVESIVIVVGDGSSINCIQVTIPFNDPVLVTALYN